MSLWTDWVLSRNEKGEKTENIDDDDNEKEHRTKKTSVSFLLLSLFFLLLSPSIFSFVVSVVPLEVLAGESLGHGDEEKKQKTEKEKKKEESFFFAAAKGSTERRKVFFFLFFFSRRTKKQKEKKLPHFFFISKKPPLQRRHVVLFLGNRLAHGSHAIKIVTRCRIAVGKDGELIRQIVEIVGDLLFFLKSRIYRSGGSDPFLLPSFSLALFPVIRSFKFRCVAFRSLSSWRK